MMISLSGKLLSEELTEATRVRIAAAINAGIRPPALAIVLATDDGGARWYSAAIKKAAHSVGIICELVDLGSHATDEQLKKTVRLLASDKSIDAIILQTPLPNGVDVDAIVELIPYKKDVDGMTALSAGRLSLNQKTFAPATAEAVMAILDNYTIDVTGKEVAIIGRSAVVGKPLMQLILSRNATATICHSRTANLERVVKRADIVIVAIGKPRFINAEHLKPGAVVVDVGTNIMPNGTLIGDVDAATIDSDAGALTPVPGGVGPVTTAILLQHIASAAAHNVDS